MRVMLNIAAMVLVSSLGFGNAALAAGDEFGARFAEDVPNAFGDPAESGVNYDAFAMDDATAAMLNDVMPASGDENEAEDIHVEADHEDDFHDQAEGDKVEEDSDSEE